MMNSILEETRARTKFLAELIERWRWVILALIGLSLLWVEVQEFLVLRVLNQAFHYFEVLQYAVLLVATGLLIELLARSNRAHKQAVRILENKHRISQKLTSHEDWKSVIQKLTEFPSEITDGVEEAYLLTMEPITGKFEITEHWPVKHQPLSSKKWDPTISCEKCLKKIPGKKSIIHLCMNVGGGSSMNVYSLDVPNQEAPASLLKFKMKPGRRLSREEEEIFNNINDEITLALQFSQDRKRLSEMRTAEAAIAERRLVSTYVHDQLGQNLGYLHLRLDQLRSHEDLGRFKSVKKELRHLQRVAHESYDIVRDILKRIQPETFPHLTNLLKEQSRTISRRGNLGLDFKTVGTPLPLIPAIRQEIFFTYCEMLNNVEKHANADKIEVRVIWSRELLEVSVKDNGVGFAPRADGEDDHFGLEIMRERVKKLNGKLTIESHLNEGTLISMSIPLEAKVLVTA